MKTPFLTLALLATIAGSAAFATQKAPQKAQPIANYTYYIEGECDVPVECSDEFSGPFCSEAYEGKTVYSQPFCNASHVVVSPLGRLPL